MVMRTMWASMALVMIGGYIVGFFMHEEGRFWCLTLAVVSFGVYSILRRLDERPS